MQALNNIVDRINKIKSGIEDPTALRCDMPNLNKILNGGFCKGNLYVVAGKESTGKASFIISVICDIIHRRRADPLRVGLITLNSSEERWVTRILSNLSGIVLETILRGWLLHAERQKINDMSQMNLFNKLEIATPGYMNLQNLIDTCSKWAFEKDVKIIFIDYLQLIAIENMPDKDLKIFTICKALKKLSTDLAIPIVITVPLKATKSPSSLKDLRKIGAIEPFADVIMFLSRIVYKPNVENDNPEEAMIISIQKNNTGQLDSVRLRAILNVQKIVEFDYV